MLVLLEIFSPISNKVTAFASQLRILINKSLTFDTDFQSIRRKYKHITERRPILIILPSISRVCFIVRCLVQAV